MFKSARAAFKMLQKHWSNGAYISAERTHCARSVRHLGRMAFRATGCRAGKAESLALPRSLRPVLDSTDGFDDPYCDSPCNTERHCAGTRACPGGKRDAQAHARTAAVLRAYVGRRVRPHDLTRLERSSGVQNVQRI